MDAIVGQFLDFARSDDSEMPSSVDLDALARDVAQASQDHGRALTLALGGVPRVSLRPLALRRALDNLVENAWRHGKPPVTLRTGSNADRVWVEVTDRGEGIATADVEALKQPFRRAASDRGGPPGAGLGLAIVERVARVHAGQFDLLPADGGGLCARLTFPREVR
jgi:two-component system osmolarity sensor histidine kinase EnvZ